MPGVNDCIPFYEQGDRLPGQAGVAGAVTGKRMLNASAARLSGPAIPATAQIGASDPTDGGDIQVNHAAAGAKAIGVSSWDAAVGDRVTVIRQGVVPVTPAADIAAGAPVEVGAAGKVQTWAGTIGTQIVGVCVDAVTLASGLDAQIALQV